MTVVVTTVVDEPDPSVYVRVELPMCVATGPAGEPELGDPVPRGTELEALAGAATEALEDPVPGKTEL